MPIPANLLNQIHEGKWETWMPQIPSNSIDLIVTSPPYNINLNYDSYADDRAWDEYYAWMCRFMAECNRVLRRGGRIAINIADRANGRVPTHAEFISMICHDERWAEYGVSRQEEFEPFDYLGTIVWNKSEVANRLVWGSYRSASLPSFPTPFEFILMAIKGKPEPEGKGAKRARHRSYLNYFAKRMERLQPTTADEFKEWSLSLWNFPSESRMSEFGHEAMFPEELPKRLIKMLSWAGDVVLDPFAGIGTTCLAAKKLDRNYVGIEMSPEYVRKVRERIRKSGLSSVAASLWDRSLAEGIEGSGLTGKVEGVREMKIWPRPIRGEAAESVDNR